MYMKMCALCERKVSRRGLCEYHYRRALKENSIKRVKVNGVVNICSIDGCIERVHGGGLCRKHYQRVRRYGRVENITSRGLKSWEEIIQKHVTIDKGTGCWVWKGKKNRYPDIYIDGENVKASRYILEQKLGRKIKEGYCACHSCDNPRCCNPEHIWEGTVGENNADKMKKGRHVKAVQYHGSANKMAKLTEKQVANIRFADDHKGAGTRVSLMNAYAKRYNVSIYTIRSVLQGKTYKNHGVFQ